MVGCAGDGAVELEVQLLHPPGHPNRPTPVAEVTLQLTEDCGHGERRELQTAVGLEPLDRLEQTHERDLAEIVERLEMRDPEIVVAGFDRPEIRLEVDHYADAHGKEQGVLDRVMAEIGEGRGPGIVYSATRKGTEEIAAQLADRGLRVIIAGAGGAAHLPGMVAAATPLPVIGVPRALDRLDGLDSLLSIVQMPAGVPVATVSIGGAKNAGLLAVRILGAGDPALVQKMADYQADMAAQVEAKDEALKQRLMGE